LRNGRGGSAQAGATLLNRAVHGQRARLTLARNGL
jgi:hypothetical protein